MSRGVIYGVLSMLLLFSCGRGVQDVGADVLVSVEGHSLLRSEVESVIPRTLSSADSLLMAESYVKKWVKDVLVYDVAEENLGEEMADVERLVEAYRHSLIRYRYQEQLVRERLSAEIRESDVLNYYETNQKKFELKTNLVKGLFLKVPIDAPGLTDLKRWYKSDDASAVEKIDKYSLQNAAIYDYFYDKWMDFEDVMENIPIQLSNPSAYLKANKTLEVSDSSYCYLLNIRDYIPAGQVAPYDYVQPQIMDMLLAQRKQKFLRDFEEELYNDAIRDGKVRFPSDEP